MIVALLHILLGCTPVSTNDNPEVIHSHDHELPEFVESDLRRSRENRIGQWIYPPGVVLCDDAPIKRERLESAIDWWENIGYSFGILHSGVRGGDCIKEKPVGKIIVTLITQDL